MTPPTVPSIFALVILLQMAPAAECSMPSEYKCNGNEPFWGLAIEGEHAGWATPEEPTGQTLEGRFVQLDYVGLFSWRGRFGAGDLVAFVTQRSCVDTMADRDYPFSISVSLPDGSVLLGCCDSTTKPSTESWSEPSRELEDESTTPELEDESTTPKLDESLADLPIAVVDEKPPGDWSRDLFDFLPAIEGCVSRTPGASPRVLKAWSKHNGNISVRTLNSEGAAFECVANRQGSVAQPLTALKGQVPGLHDGWSPVFTLQILHPPTGECYQHERVVGVDGELIGWLSYDTC